MLLGNSCVVFRGYILMIGVFLESGRQCAVERTFDSSPPTCEICLALLVADVWLVAINDFPVLERYKGHRTPKFSSFVNDHC